MTRLAAWVKWNRYFPFWLRVIADAYLAWKFHRDWKISLWWHVKHGFVHKRYYGSIPREPPRSRF